MLFTKFITDLPDIAVCFFTVMILFEVNVIRCTKDQMIMNMSFINMGCYDI